MSMNRRRLLLRHEYDKYIHFENEEIKNRLAALMGKGTSDEITKSDAESFKGELDIHLSDKYKVIKGDAFNFNEAAFFSNADIYMQSLSIGEITIPAYTSPHTLSLAFCNVSKFIIPEGTTTLPKRAFWMWYRTDHPVVIPESVRYITNTLTNQASCTIDVIFKSNKPPVFTEIGSNTSPFYYNNANIYVPDDAIDAYRTAKNWELVSKFIHPISEYKGNY